ncbi:hypothetical protein [Sphingobium yanoikuyae]|uniref:Uncharacterized protein n=1 Tax=Sphingobium yanoikuyae TaxID=13690 RepID=A0A3G2US61_SPHYA|nr:hypothetical protein [Sphingobium yanoikuyae]AYO75641.1 hypothetical protein EBF16_01200 [Sphingobium yanoikuyae]AYO75646.1 hypothetical protein EBF16_01235 [Sphingobium yanoikuyae]
MSAIEVTRRVALGAGALGVGAVALSSFAPNLAGPVRGLLITELGSRPGRAMAEAFAAQGWHAIDMSWRNLVGETRWASRPQDHGTIVVFLPSSTAFVVSMLLRDSGFASRFRLAHAGSAPITQGETELSEFASAAARVAPDWLSLCQGVAGHAHGCAAMSGSPFEPSLAPGDDRHFELHILGRLSGEGA